MERQACDGWSQNGIISNPNTDLVGVPKMLKQLQIGFRKREYAFKKPKRAGIRLFINDFVNMTN